MWIFSEGDSPSARDAFMRTKDFFRQYYAAFYNVGTNSLELLPTRRKMAGDGNRGGAGGASGGGNGTSTKKRPKSTISLSLRVKTNKSESAKKRRKASGSRDEGSSVERKGPSSPFLVSMSTGSTQFSARKPSPS
ncbi:hypothetical protein BDZ45DRAFT_729853 [Acephala macrosclerotiorum]|nr:hypothetical protein BDZ45DRAFT_729853 [Acephala macrosclerotiorum]